MGPLRPLSINGASSGLTLAYETPKSEACTLAVRFTTSDLGLNVLIAVFCPDPFNWLDLAGLVRRQNLLFLVDMTEGEVLEKGKHQRNYE